MMIARTQCFMWQIALSVVWPTVGAH